MTLLWSDSRLGSKFMFYLVLLLMIESLLKVIMINDQPKLQLFECAEWVGGWGGGFIYVTGFRVVHENDVVFSFFLFLEFFSMN